MEESTLTKALEALEAAAVKDKDTLMNLLKDRYSSLKDALIDSKDSIAQTINYATQRAVDAATHAREIAEAKAKEYAATVDKSVHANPWAYIGGAATVGILVGYILGRNK